MRVSFSPHDNLSTLLVLDVDRLAVECGFTSMLTQCPNVQQGLRDPWENICLSCLKRQVWVSQEGCVRIFYDFPIWHLDGDKMDSILFVAVQ